jgi:HSP20 family protein
MTQSKPTTTATAVEPTIPSREEDKALTTREETRFVAPPVDIYENADSLVVITDLPGVAPGDVSVRVDEGILTIQGKTRYEAPQDMLYDEFGLVDFYRQFQLTDEVDQEKISGDLKNGVLTVQLPKAEKAKPRKIEVKVTG